MNTITGKNINGDTTTAATTTSPPPPLVHHHNTHTLQTFLLFSTFFVVTYETVKVAINRPGMGGKKLHPFLGVQSLRISCNNLIGNFRVYLNTDISSITTTTNTTTVTRKMKNNKSDGDSNNSNNNNNGFGSANRSFYRDMLDVFGCRSRCEIVDEKCYQIRGHLHRILESIQPDRVNRKNDKWHHNH